ncbi:DUF3231 family protein [Bacillus lacus]|uniref:DUF3231 family protein n=1 Tax=Metabacillus lacus TaxID=1983721 RepID=A0A7X2LY97_9BACI|nr:DUF3231 family protein [Metabacillus lacus]MRX70672.1 DUF3231 family protein [Metabacillus lacus]
MAIFSGKPEEQPLHSGEVYHLWAHLLDSKCLLVTLQVFSNHCGDPSLKIFLEDVMENCVTQEAQQVEAILKESGIRLPPAPPDRPNVAVEDIPAGARFNDPEIAAMMQKELVAGKMFQTAAAASSVREDISSLFGEFYVQRAEYEEKLLVIQKEKGWLVLPPVNIK